MMGENKPKEIEVTPEMIKAGRAVLYEHGSDWADSQTDAFIKSFLVALLTKMASINRRT